MKPFLRSLAILWLLLGAIGQAKPQYIYYSEAITGTIWRANLDGSAQTPLINGLRGPVGPSLDLAGGKMYWSEGQIGVMRRANVDGSGAEDLVSGLPMGDFTLMAPSLDLVRAQMYWPVYSPGAIWRANLDGSAPTILIDGLPNPRGVALHLGDGKIYWADRFGGDIWRADIDGSGQTRLLGALSAPEVIALDIASGKIYWGDLIDRQILRANLDGTSKEIVVPVMPDLSPGAGPVGIALDVAGGKIYWTDVDLSGPNGDVRRANLDGSGQEVLVKGLDRPAWISLDLGGPRPAVSFVVVAASASVAPATPFDITVTALDPFGNIDVNYQGTVTFSTTDSNPGIVLPADYTFTAADAGVHTFPGGVTFITPGDQTVTTTDTASGITGKASITIVP